MKYQSKPMSLCVMNLARRSRAATSLHRSLLAISAAVALGAASPAFAATNYFFSASQTATLVVSNLSLIHI